MSDLIDRQAAIDAICMEWCNVKHQDCKHSFDVEKDDYYWCDGCETVLRTLPDLPSVQPTQKNDSNTLDALDCVSRKAAIEAIMAEIDDVDRPNVELRWWNLGLTRASEILKQLPSAQPDKNMIHLQKEQAYMQGWEDGREALRAQPEIIRCKECKHWEYDVIFADGWCRGKQQGNPEWFCADAERRTDG